MLYIIYLKSYISSTIYCFITLVYGWQVLKVVWCAARKEHPPFRRCKVKPWVKLRWNFVCILYRFCDVNWQSLRSMQNRWRGVSCTVSLFLLLSLCILPLNYVITQLQIYTLYQYFLRRQYMLPKKKPSVRIKFSHVLEIKVPKQRINTGHIIGVHLLTSLTCILSQWLFMIQLWGTNLPVNLSIFERFWWNL